MNAFPVLPLSDPLPKSQSPAAVVNVMPFAPPVDDVLLKVAVPDGVAEVTLIAIPLDDTLVFATVKPVTLVATKPVAAVEIAIPVMTALVAAVTVDWRIRRRADVGGTRQGSRRRAAPSAASKLTPVAACPTSH